MLDYISYVQAKGYNLNLFDSTEFYPSSTKTVNDTFDSISYGSQASFNTVAKDYGAYYAFLLWLYRDNDAKKQELLDKWGFEVNYKDITDEPYLILVDDAMKAELNKMTDQEISDTYLINLSDVDDFRYYVRSNKNVVLYRFDVTDYYSELLDFSSTPVKGIFNPDPEQYAVVQQSIYYNFKVIDLTFELEDGYHSYVVNSDPKDFTSDPGYVDTDKPPVDFDSGEIKDNLEDGWDKFVNKLEEFKKKFEDLQKTFDKVVRIVLISTAVVIAAVGVKFAYSGIVKVSKNKKQNERKNSSKKE